MVCFSMKVIVFLMLFSYGSTLLQAADSERITLSISLEKDTFLVDEPVYLFAETKNMSNEMQFVGRNDFSLPWMSRFIVNSRGDTLQYMGPITDFVSIPGSRGPSLGPNESFLHVADMLYTYGKRDSMHKGRFYLPADEYTIQVTQHLPNAGDLGPNILVSEKLSFKVIEPDGRELEARNEILKARADYEKSRYDPKYDKVFVHQIRKYPDSVFLPLVYDKLVYLLGFSTRGQSSSFDITKLLFEAIERNPDSAFAQRAVRIFYSYRDEEKSIELLNSVKEKYPNSAAARFADHKIKRLEKDKNIKFRNR